MKKSEIWSSPRRALTGPPLTKYRGYAPEISLATPQVKIENAQHTYFNKINFATD